MYSCIQQLKDMTYYCAQGVEMSLVSVSLMVPLCATEDKVQIHYSIQVIVYVPDPGFNPD